MPAKISPLDQSEHGPRPTTPTSRRHLQKKRTPKGKNFRDRTRLFIMPPGATKDDGSHILARRALEVHSRNQLHADGNRCCDRCHALLLFKMDQWLSTTKGMILLLLSVLLISEFSFAFLILFVAWDATPDYEEIEASYGEGNFGIPQGFAESIWLAWGWTTDPGTHSNMMSLRARVAGGMVTVFGILFFAFFVAIIVEKMSQRMSNLRFGRSVVPVSNHVLILGWSHKLRQTVVELCLSMESEPDLTTIVIQSKRNKAAMEDDLAHMIPTIDRRGTRIIVRTVANNSFEYSDLERVCAREARAIVVLSPPIGPSMPPDMADGAVLRTVLNIKGLVLSPKTHIVAELCDIDNMSIFHIVGGADIQTVVSHDVIGRLMIKCVRKPGLSLVYEEFLGFHGDEVYFEHWPSLEGKTFGEVLFCFPDGVPIGVVERSSCEPLTPQDISKMKQRHSLHTRSNWKKKKQRHKARYANGHQVLPNTTPSKGKRGEDLIYINPKDDYMIGPCTDIITLAEDDDSYKPVELHSSVQLLTHEGNSKRWKRRPPLKPVRMLICGWRRDMEDTLKLLNQLLAPGSEITLFNSVPIGQRQRMLEEDGKLELKNLHNINFVHIEGQANVRRHLKKLEMALVTRKFASIMVIADQSLEHDAMHSDSHTLACLLLLKDIQTPPLHKVQRVVNSEAFRALVTPTAATRAAARLGTAGKLRGTQSSRSASVRSVYEESKKHAQRNGNETPDHGLDSQYHFEPSKDTYIICEILDVRTKALISKNHQYSNSPSSFILSTDIIAKVLAMVAERAEVNLVMETLLGASDHELSLKSCLEYSVPGETLSFWQLAKRVRRTSIDDHRDNLVGWILKMQDSDDETVDLNPADKTKGILFHPGDLLVVISTTVRNSWKRPPSFVLKSTQEDIWKRPTEKTQEVILEEHEEDTNADTHAV